MPSRRPEILALIAPLDDAPTHVCVRAERALNARLHGGCQVPIAAHAEIVDGALRMRAMVGSPDGRRVLLPPGKAVSRMPRPWASSSPKSCSPRAPDEILKALHQHHDGHG